MLIFFFHFTIYYSLPIFIHIKIIFLYSSYDIDSLRHIFMIFTIMMLACERWLRHYCWCAAAAHFHALITHFNNFFIYLSLLLLFYHFIIDVLCAHDEGKNAALLPLFTHTEFKKFFRYWYLFHYADAYEKCSDAHIIIYFIIYFFTLLFLLFLFTHHFLSCSPPLLPLLHFSLLQFLISLHHHFLHTSLFMCFCKSAGSCRHHTCSFSCWKLTLFLPYAAIIW